MMLDMAKKDCSSILVVLLLQEYLPLVLLQNMREVYGKIGKKSLESYKVQEKTNRRTASTGINIRMFIILGLEEKIKQFTSSSRYQSGYFRRIHGGSIS